MPTYRYTDRYGTALNVEGPQPPTEEILDQIFSDHYESQRTVGGQAEEFAKAIPRGFANSFLSMGEGLAAITNSSANALGYEEDVFEQDGDFLGAVREGRNFLQEEMGPEAAYADEWTTKFGEGIGSFATFLTPTAALKLAGMAGKILPNVAATTALAGTAGAGEGIQRVEQARATGLDVTDEQENEAVLYSTLVGFSELAPVGRVLRFLPKGAYPDTIRKKMVDKIVDASLSGGIEGAQEVAASYMQDAIERGVYNPDLAERDSFMDEFTVGAGVGALAELVLNSAAGRRKQGATQAEIEKEQQEREIEENDLAEDQKAVDRMIARRLEVAREGEAAAIERDRLLEQRGDIDPAQIEFPAPDPIGKKLGTPKDIVSVQKTLPDGTMASFQGQLKTRKNGKTTTTYVESQDADGKIGKIDIQYQKEDQPPVFAKGVVSVNTIGQQESVVDRQVGSRKLGGEKTSAAVATKNAKKYAQHIRRSMDDANGYFPTNKTFVIQPLPNARFGAFDSSGQQYGSSFETYNEAAQLASALHDEAISKQTGLGVITRIESSPDSIDGEDLSVMQRWGRRIMHPLENLISFTSVNEAAGTTQVEGFDELSSVKQLIGKAQNEAQLVDGLTAAQKINRYRLSKNLPEVNSFSPAEIRTVLGNDFIEKLPDSVYFAGRDPTASQDLNYTPIDENVSVASLKKLLLQKNISSKIDSPEVDRMVKSFVGANNISEVGPGGRKLLAQRIATLPRFTKPTKLVDFTPRTYTADQLKSAISHVENNKDFTEESILESTNIDPSDNRARIKVRDMIAEMNARGVLKDGKSPVSEEIDSASTVVSEEFRLPSTIGQQVSPQLTIGAEDKVALLNSLKKHLDKYGLKDVGLSLEYALQRAVRDSSGNFHYGIRRKLDGDTDVETIDPDGNFVFAGEVDPDAEGYYSPRMNSIFLSIDRLTNNASTIEEAEAELISTLDHEAIHAMRQMDLWTDKEWQGLEKAARNTVDRSAEGDDAGSTYLQMAQKRYAEDSPVVQMEEAIAEMTRDARADLRLGGKPRSSLTRIADFFRRLISFLRGSGYQSFNDLIDRIESGEVGARARGEVRTLRAIEGQAGTVPDRGIVAAGDSAMPIVGAEEKQQVPDFPEQTGQVIDSDKINFSKKKKIPFKEPKNTQKAYKLFTAKRGVLYPLFVDAKTPVPIGEWIPAADVSKETFTGANGLTYVKATTGGRVNITPEEAERLFNLGVIKSPKTKSVQAVASRPGWHSGDLPVAPHIGGKTSKKKSKPDFRKDNQVWAEIEVPADVDWQSVANENATLNKDGSVNVKTAQVTDRIPSQGFYRYKTNPNMFENWMISGEIKVIKPLSDAEVKQINDEAGIADLPRRKGAKSPDILFSKKKDSKIKRDTQKDLADEQALRPEQRGVRGRGYQGRELEALEGAPIKEGTTGPIPEVVDVANQYALDNDIALDRQQEYVRVDVPRAERIAKAYDEMLHDPKTPRVAEAYENLKKQTRAQYDSLIDAGYEFTFFDSLTDPYDGNPYNAMRDLRNNKSMAVYATYDGYGETPISLQDIEDNPMLSDTGLRWKDQQGKEHPVTANDLFRAVHDVFGHGLEGAGFRARGEENAWQAHAKLYTGSALPALTTETRGQNSWLNFGPYGESNRTAKLEDTVFAEQKTGIMPEFTWTEGLDKSSMQKLLEADRQKQTPMRQLLEADRVKARETTPNPIPEQKVADAVRKDINLAFDASSGNVPRVNFQAGPEAQYVGNEPEKSVPPTREDDIRFSRSKEPEYNAGFEEATGSLSSNGVPRETAFQTYNKVTDLGPIDYFLTWVKQKVVNKYARLEQMSKNFANHLGNSSAMSAALMADRAKAILGAAIKYGTPTYKNGTVYVEDFIHNGKKYRGLMGLMAPLHPGGNQYEVSLEELAKRYAIFRRSEYLAERGLKTPLKNPAEAEAALMEEINKYVDPETGKPIVTEWYDAWQAYNNKTIQFLKDTGMIDEQGAQDWQAASVYYPFYKQAEEDGDVKGPYTYKGLTGTVNFKSVGKSERAIDVPMLEAITKNLDAAIDMGMKNIAQQRIIRDAASMGLARELGPKEREGDMHVVTFKVNGVQRKFEMYDPLLFQSLQAMGGQDLSGIVKMLGFPANVLREMVTREPGFVVANMFRDTLSAFVTSGANFVPIVDTVRGFATGTEQLEKFGVVGGYDFNRDPKNIVNFIARESRKSRMFGGLGTPIGEFTGDSFGEKTFAKIEQGMEAPGLKAFKMMWQGLGAMTTKSDAATRQAVFNDVLARTGNYGEAQIQALEVINFARRGSSPAMNAITAMIPFLNARLQGLDVLYRGATGRYSAKRELPPGLKTAHFFARGGLLVGLTALYYTMVSDDEEYKSQDDYIKDDNFIIPLKMFGIEDMPPLKLPVPFEVGVLFKTIPERIMSYINDESTPRDVRETMQRAITNTLEVNPPQFILPLVEAATNHNLYTGRSIVPVWMDSQKEAWEQYKYTTNELAVEIGKSLNISPMKVEHIMSGYGGTLGGYLLSLTDSMMRGEGRELPTKRLDQYPLMKRFFARPEGNYLQAEFYDLLDSVKKFSGTVDSLTEQGRLEELDGYLKTRSGLANIAKEVNYLSRRVSSLRRQKNSILEMDIDPDLKKELSEQIDSEINQTLQIMPELKRIADREAFPEAGY